MRRTRAMQRAGKELRHDATDRRLLSLAGAAPAPAAPTRGGL